MLYHRDVLGVIGQSGYMLKRGIGLLRAAADHLQRTSLLFYIADEKVWVCRVYMFQ